MFIFARLAGTELWNPGGMAIFNQFVQFWLVDYHHVWISHSPPFLYKNVAFIQNMVVDQESVDRGIVNSEIVDRGGGVDKEVIDRESIERIVDRKRDPIGG